jgi:hypothetical protein
MSVPEIYTGERACARLPSKEQQRHPCRGHEHLYHMGISLIIHHFSADPLFATSSVPVPGTCITHNSSGRLVLKQMSKMRRSGRDFSYVEPSNPPVLVNDHPRDAPSQQLLLLLYRGLIEPPLKIQYKTRHFTSDLAEIKSRSILGGLRKAHLKLFPFPLDVPPTDRSG